MSQPVQWVIGKKTYNTELIDEPCPFCGQQAIVKLPPPMAKKERDGTTHVCMETLGGCNHGFAMETLIDRYQRHRRGK